MTAINIIPFVLVSIGLLLMLYNVVAHWNLLNYIRIYSPMEFRHIRVLGWFYLLLVVLFASGYLAFLIGLYIDFQSNNYLIGMMFFLGAVFVTIGIHLKRKMLGYIRLSYEKLLAAHISLKEEQDRLQFLNRDLRAMNDERDAAQESERLKSDFLSLVSHELRTPLTSIYGFTKLIRRDWNAYLYAPLTKEESERRLQRLDTNLEIISNECNRLTRMINNLLNLAKIESGQMEWNDQCITPFALLKHVFALLQGIIKENTQLRFLLDVDKDVPDLTVDPDLITQVVINLMFNAIKHTEEGEIRVHAVKDDDGVVLSVSDTGTGISKEHLEMIFDKFQVVRQGDTMLSSATGTGLGLAICREIVEHYGGRIWAESELGKGSTFFVRLPSVIIAPTACEG